MAPRGKWYARHKRQNLVPFETMLAAAVMLKLGIKQPRIASCLGIKHETLRQWIRGRTRQKDWFNAVSGAITCLLNQ